MDTRDRKLFCYRISQIYSISESGATTPLNTRYPKTDYFSEAKAEESSFSRCKVESKQRGKEKLYFSAA